MKKIASLLLALVLLSTATVALADDYAPNLSRFAQMKTQRIGNVIYITLTKPVDKLYVNWLGELRLAEVEISEDLTGMVLTSGHTYQPGVGRRNQLDETPNFLSFRVVPAGSSPAAYAAAVAQSRTFLDEYYNVLDRRSPTAGRDGFSYVYHTTNMDSVPTLLNRAYISIQGEFIVCYNRRGDIVDVMSAGKDVHDVAYWGN